jgi:hypothetical protein
MQFFRDRSLRVGIGGRKIAAILRSPGQPRAGCPHMNLPGLSDLESRLARCNGQIAIEPYFQCGALLEYQIVAGLKSR